MARKWPVSEAVAAIKSGDAEARIDIGRRYPLFSTATLEEIVGALPDYVTARKIEATLKDKLGVGSEETEEPKKEETAKKKTKKEVEAPKKKKTKKEVEAPKKKSKKEEPKKKSKKAVKEEVDDDEDEELEDDEEEDEEDEDEDEDSLEDY